MRDSKRQQTGAEYKTYRTVGGAAEAALKYSDETGDPDVWVVQFRDGPKQGDPGIKTSEMPPDWQFLEVIRLYFPKFPKESNVVLWCR
jgi:hypothetical protein